MGMVQLESSGLDMVKRISVFGRNSLAWSSGNQYGWFGDYQWVFLTFPVHIASFLDIILDLVQVPSS